MANEIIGKLPDDMAALITGNTPIQSIFHLSEVLVRQKKIDEDVMKKAEELVVMSHLHFDQPHAQLPHGGRERSRRKGVTKKLMEEGLAEAASSNPKKRKKENTELELVDYIEYAGNEGELDKFLGANLVVDRFMEMRDPNDHSAFRPNDARALYEHMFPNKDEAEDWKGSVLPRIREMARLEAEPELKRKYGDSRFHSIVAVNDGDVVGYSQFSTMPVGGGSVVVFGQYTGVADKRFMEQNYHRKETFREEGVHSAVFVFRHGIAAEDAKEMGYHKGVIGTIIESEFKGQADNADDIRFTNLRLHIHRQHGAKAMILEMEDGSWVSAHMQPRLSADSNPIILHMLFRPLKFDEADTKRTTTMDIATAQSLIMSYIDNFDREGFDPKDVDEARKILLERFSKAKRVLLVPPEELPDISAMARMDPLLREQVERDYGSMELQEERIRSALASKPSPEARRLGS
ncbi:MAG: hypothetical protein AB1324_05910 [Candidatus Micrarchaeota archaeon]